MLDLLNGEYWFVYIFITLLGLAMGSFLNSWVWRAHENIRITGRSICHGCRRQLSWYENIPLFSYMVLLGRCRTCKSKIPSHFFWVELITALLFVFNAWYHLQSGKITSICFFRHLLLIIILITIFQFDLFYSVIPTDVAVLGIVSMFALNLYAGEVSLNSMLLGILIAAGFFLAQFLLSRGKWIGGGDIILGILMGAAVGAGPVLVALMIAYVLGAMGSIYLLAVKKRGMNGVTPFGTYLAVGTLIASFWGPEIVKWYLGFIR